MVEDTNFKHILRIVNTDLDGNKLIKNALRQIHGVSFMFANLACKLTNTDKNKRTGNLTDAEVQKLETFFKDPAAHGVPDWFLNRRRDPYDGKTSHILATDIKYVLDNDLKVLKMIKCYRGVRHLIGQPVRGQRTKSNFRRNKGKGLGVTKKALAPAASKDKAPKDNAKDKKGKK